MAGDHSQQGHGRARDRAGAVVNRVGLLTRRLHDSLHELGYDRLIEDAVQAMPDARDRLDYVVNMTNQAANRVINATEIAGPIQEALARDAARLLERWRATTAAGLPPEAAALAAEIRGYLERVPAQAAATREQLLDIVMAQEFQDLTGQVIRKLTDVLRQFEAEVVQLLLEHAPTRPRPRADNGLLNGPQVNPAGKPDVVGSQDQVDSLLESLGF